LFIVNPSLLLGPGDDRLSSTSVILDFLARKIPSIPSGGINLSMFVMQLRPFVRRWQNGNNRERYLLGAANWTFEKFFGRLERLTKVAAPRLSLPSRLVVSGSKDG